MTQDEALSILKTGANVFLTGEPGSGKTYTVNRFTEYLRERGVEPSITASTGIAATHIGGFTVHSWSGIGVRLNLTEYDLDHIASNKRVYGRVNNARVLVIDEVSMLSARILEMVDAVCREIRRHPQPFGGLQVVFVGDFFQLPPVSASERQTSGDCHSRDSHPSPSRLRQGFGGQVRSSPLAGERGNPELFNDPSASANARTEQFAFTSPVWQKANPLVCYLSEQHRQEDRAFLEFLSAVRKGAVEERHKALLRTRYAKAPQSGGITQLYSHNADVDYINSKELAKLLGESRSFVMEDHGPEPLVQSLKRGCLSPETLSLKIGARVMFTKNDPEWRFVNGTTGVVMGFSRDTGTAIVKTTGGREVRAEPMEWSLQDAGRILARISQVPLRLAWAITVHKSQGMSLDSAHMDLSSAFEYGQGYVALSRVRTLKGVSLAGLNARALEVHPKVSAQDQRFRAASDAARKKFSALEKAELAKMHDNFIRAMGGKPGAGKLIRPKKEKGDTLALTKDLALHGLSLPEIADERDMTIGTIIRHLEQLAASGAINPVRDLAHLSPDPGRLAQIERAFSAVFAKTKETKLTPVRELLDDSFSYEELHLARLFVDAQK